LVKLTSPQTFKIVEYILSHPQTSQVEISRIAGVSRNLVNYVVSALETPGVLLQRMKGHLELVDPLRLLEAISLERPLSKLVESEVRTEESEPTKVERMVRNAAVHGKEAYALTAFSALTKYTEYYLSYPTVHLYAGRPLELATTIPKGRGDVAVQVLRPDSELIMKEVEKRGDFAVVQPIQVVIDLFCLGGPGRDGAMKLYQQMMQDNGQT
jgi:hypothetical protein